VRTGKNRGIEKRIYSEIKTAAIKPGSGSV
jgi:hypothetical protein